MRILIVNRHRSIVGGVETYLERLLPLLAAKGLSLALVHLEPPQPDSKTIDAALNIQNWLWKPGFDWSAIEAWKPDVAYLQSLFPPELHSELSRRVPVLQYVHDYRGLCISGHKMHLSPEPIPCRRAFGAACLLHYFPRRCGGLNPLVMFDLYRQESNSLQLLKLQKSVLVATEHMRKEYLRNGLNPERVSVLRLPSTTQTLAPPVSPPSDGAILFLGRLSQQKGANFLIRAAELAQDRLGRKLRVIVCGSGPEEENLKLQAKSSSVSVEMRGWISSAERLEVLKQSSLLALPSLWPEPFGMAGLEAATHGIPAVAFDSGGITEWLRPGVSGEVAPADPPTPEGLADAILRVVSDATRYQSLSRGALETAAEFSTALHLSELLIQLQKASRN
jgi:glycosyltransferase involved in cell wall biosynthesis